MKKFYVVGNKSSKSLSPLIFNYWFKKYKIKAKYGFVELNNRNFHSKIKEILKLKNVYGLNITIPFKEKIIKHVDSMDNHSKKINAINCVTIGSKIKGINTDWIGYYKTLPRKKNINKMNTIIIGYGGAAMAIHHVLFLKGFKNVKIFNRSKKTLKFEKSKKYTTDLKKIEKHLSNADIIINTTPSNPINTRWANLVGKKTIISDIVYKPKETNFLKLFPDNPKIYGISMLLKQAVPCFKHWFGFSPSIDPKLIDILDKKLND